MKKNILLLSATFAFLAATTTTAQTSGNNPVMDEEEKIKGITPTYLENTFASEPFTTNWFVSLKVGLTTFIGSPVGHGDIFDRQKPLLNIAAGKWFTPYVGARAAFQGLYLKDADLQSRAYQNIHADLLYNVASHFRNGTDRLAIWDCAPFVGFGIIHNNYSEQKPFALSYGVIGRYRLTERLHLTGELAGTTTWKSFDGQGSEKRLGDNLLQMSVGISYAIGKTGWKKVIDSAPYILQNDLLLSYATKLDDENRMLAKKQQENELALKEMRKILEIEGLLDKYNLNITTPEEVKSNPNNNYNGLNALKARLRGKGMELSNDKMKTHSITEETNNGEIEAEKYFQVMKDGKIYVGAPIFFFFHVGTDELTEVAQVINIKEVAAVAKRYNLSARVVGAADSQTGTAYANEILSAKRSQYIARLLQQHGVPEERIETQHRGGINSYEPQTGNRNTCVMLYFQQ